MKRVAISLTIRKSAEVDEDLTDHEAKEILVEWASNLKLSKEEIRRTAQFMVERNPWLPLGGGHEKLD